MRLQIIGAVIVIAATAYFSYDYGVASTELANQKRQNELLDKMEQKQDEAFTLSVELAKQQPIVDIQYRTVEKEVIKYAQANNDKQCIANDHDWLLIRANAVRTHNQSIGVQQPAPVPDDPTQTTRSDSPYQQDAEVLAEDVSNLKTCAENAKQLLSLQTWIKAQLPSYQEEPK